MRKKWCVYIATNKPHGVLYIGKTGNISMRSMQHVKGKGAAFTKKYNCKQIVYVEWFDTEQQALRRERQLKSWRRSWKIELIEKQNKDWKNYVD